MNKLIDFPVKKRKIWVFSIFFLVFRLKTKKNLVFGLICHLNNEIRARYNQLSNINV